MKVGWIDFNKKEERLLTRSLFFGVFLGLPLGTLISIFLVLPTIPRQFPQNLFEWTRVIFLFMASLMFSSWLTSTAFAYAYYKKRKEQDSIDDFTKFAFALFIGLPLALMYATMTSLITLIPFNSLFSQWLTMNTLFLLGMLLVFPFVFLYIAIIMPDSKPRKILNRQLRKLKKSMQR
jgi:MFS family permease